jgi:hypothetical protein
MELFTYASLAQKIVTFKLSSLFCSAVCEEEKKVLFDKKTFENQVESCLSSFRCFLSGRPFIAVPLCTEVRSIDVYGAH